MVWSIIHSMFMLVVCFLTPFNLAFSEKLKDSSLYLSLNNAIDIFFTMDILVNLNTAVVITSAYYLVNDSRCAIFWDYLRSWLIIDLLSVLPIEYIFNLYNSTDSEMDGTKINMNQFVRIARISKLYKLAKITQLFRFLKVCKSKKKIEQRVTNILKNGAAYDRLMFFIMCLLLMSHFMSCLWIFVG